MTTCPVKAVQQSRLRAWHLIGVIALMGPTAASAAGPFDSCTLGISTSGSLRAATSGSILSSEVAGGSAATMTVVAVGGNPTLLFSAAALTTAPAGYNHTPVVEIKYTSLAGGNQPYTVSASSYRASLLLDTVTINARVTDTRGYKAGTYSVGTTVTCQL